MERFLTAGAEAWLLRRFLMPFYYPGSFAVGLWMAKKYAYWRWPNGGGLPEMGGESVAHWGGHTSKGRGAQSIGEERF